MPPVNKITTKSNTDVQSNKSHTKMNSALFDPEELVQEAAVMGTLLLRILIE